ncbi:hypothetical protein [Deinococcus multiflagellatus]|uniref:Uncharacterized protein n=1 Tax=Deinococcus multiflagellatus TaxID=1656887 RepID=A0ABW1ZGC3_9DEIO
MTSPDHARLNERVLSHWEQERDGQVQGVAAALLREARALQDTLEEFAAQVQAARFPAPAGDCAGCWDERPPEAGHLECQLAAGPLAAGAGVAGGAGARRAGAAGNEAGRPTFSAG